MHGNICLDGRHYALFTLHLTWSSVSFTLYALFGIRIDVTRMITRFRAVIALKLEPRKNKLPVSGFSESGKLKNIV